MPEEFKSPEENSEEEVKQPSHENRAERIVTEEEVIEALRTKGAENAEARAILGKWKEQNQAEANKENTTTANIKEQIKLARFYKKAGFPKEAVDVLEDSLLNLDQEKGIESRKEQNKALIQEVESLIKEIEGK